MLGQSISQTGNWFQQTAEAWLILQLTGSATALGIYTLIRFGPLLLFGVQAGVFTDRFDHLKLMWITTTLNFVTISVLTISAFSAAPSLALLYGTVFVRGCTLALDNPLRRSFARDLVSDGELPNAVSINATMHTIARFIGPALAGLLLSQYGAAWCFGLNALSYVPVLIALFLIDRHKLRPASRVAARRGQVVEGFRYAWSVGKIRRTLIMVTLLGLLVLNTWDVILPLYAKRTFGGDAALYGSFVSIMGLGAFVGGVAGLRMTRITGSFFRVAVAFLAIALAIVAAAPALPVAYLGLATLGASATLFQIGAQSRLQLEADDTMSGRILALYSVALVGTRPVGGLISGWVVDLGDPRLGFAVAAASSLAVLVMLIAMRPSARRESASVIGYGAIAERVEENG